MTVYVLTNAPQKLRGILSRYCLEVQSGLFVGRLDKRMRELLWEKVGQLATKKTRGVMIWRTNNAQGFTFETYGILDTTPVSYDGIWLIGRHQPLPDIANIEIVNITNKTDI
ncbi:MAG: type I-E CRISPR-associated endoribonuclease Cas2 [Ignavibacteriae bacterium]|nr:type I-E CRISPR-associated endoribonuclease Cas2 [Ignavibacteriota bacterium]MCB9216861.1 type I-E CRISPR-associated endoribonuclease Cas2 [Ignavibacteria bacterium]